MQRKPILCVDFDGVIHAYTSPWTGAHNISDGPVPGALRWLLKATKHFDVHIYSSRSKIRAGTEAMARWFAVESLNELSDEEANELNDAITFAHEKPAAFLTIDDRGICFMGDWNDPRLDPEGLLQFRPWNKTT